MIEESIDRYAALVAGRPLTVLTIFLGVTAVLVSGATKVETVQQNVEDFLPDTFSEIQALETINAEFSSAEATTYTVLIEARPKYANSNEIRDMRDPRLLQYISLIESETRQLDKVSSVDTPLNLFSEVPPTKREVENTLETVGKERWSQFISDDFSAAKIDIRATGISAEEEVGLANDIRNAIESNPKPPGIDLTYTGQTYIDQAFQNQSQNTNQLTTTVAFLLVLVVVIVLFRSIYYGITSLQALIFGIAAGFGLFGHLGLNLSPSTSGAISIGIGIAIDFGIQPVMRYREEREELDMQEALSTTIKGVYRPMTLGVIAALMGFSALSIGRITFLSSLGAMLSLTTFFSYLAAFTIIPTTVILHDRYISHRITDFKKYYSKVKQS